MLIPYGTDAPVYYWPYTTVAMIVVNVLVFLGVMSLEGAMSEENFERLVIELCLTYGHGLRPWQWVTSNFMHADFMHLLGNMFCLWGFGLVVEGKVGWWRFLLIFLGIGVTQCAIEQTLMLFADQGLSLGASAIVYGLMAVSLVWAPQNEMNCIFILFRVFVFDVTIYALSGIALGIEILTGAFAGLAISSQILHLMGAGAGFAIAVIMLNRGWVDCEGWDLFNVWRGTQNEEKEEDDTEAQELLRESQKKRLASWGNTSSTESDRYRNEPVSPVQYPRTFPTTPVSTTTGAISSGPLFPDPIAEDPALAAMRAEIAAGSPQRAFEEYEKFAADPLNWPMPERELTQIISLFQQQKQWGKSVPAMVEYLRHFTSRAPQVRLKLGHVLLEASRRPAQALAVLRKVDEKALSEKELAMLVKLRQKATESRNQHPDEVVEDW